MSKNTGDQQPTVLEKLPRFDLGQYVERSYLNYAMYVVLDRALPQLADGLKPVQRRILYAMSELSLGGSAKPKKAARTIGDVIGKYHPHGDAASYSAMVHMAQPFAMRYPLIEGQGNWGSQEDPSSFAAMRYTEAKLSHYTDSLLSELQLGTVDWQDNFDSTLQEPKLLSAKVPNILANGATGIAVGMTTHIPPHNLRELIEASILLLRQPTTSIEELCKIVKAPDFAVPVSILASEEELLALYKYGKGAVTTRSKWRVEDDNIIISSISPQLSVNQLVGQIGKKIIDNKFPDLVDVRDEGDADEPVRIALIRRSNRVDPEAVMQQLFASTDCQKTMRFTFNIIGLDGKPRIYGLKQLLLEWLDFRRATVVRRLEFRLGQVQRRLHLLNAYLLAFDVLDQVIHIIRTEDAPKPLLKKLLGIDDLQVDAVMELRLRQLAKLSLQILQKEHDQLLKEGAKLEKTLNSKAAMTRLLINELQEAAETWGDERRCQISNEVPAAHTKLAAAQVAKEPLTVILSQEGWARTMKTAQPALEKLTFRMGDYYGSHTIGYTTNTLMVFSRRGQCYNLRPTQLPAGRGHGEPLTRHLDLGTDNIANLLLSDTGDRVLLSSSSGLGFWLKSESLLTRRTAGKLAFTLQAGQTLLTPARIDAKQVAEIEKCLIVAATAKGQMLAFPSSELPSYSAGGRGVKLIDLKASTLVAAVPLYPDQELEVDTGRKVNQKLSYQAVAQKYGGKRGGKGFLLPRGYTKVSTLRIVDSKTDATTENPTYELEG